MVQLTRIYTKSGDKGKTSLGNGQRIEKNSLRIEAIGSVDEVNSTIGLAILYCSEEPIKILLQKIQNNLFDMGADLCVPDLDTELDYQPLRITQEQVDFLETQIDLYNAQLNPLTSFVLPGGTSASAYMHLCRTITRRAERIICALRDETSNDSINLVLCYINRLSDLFFVLGRYLNDKGKNDILWQPGK